MAPSLPVVFATQRYAYLQAALCQGGTFHPGAIVREQFPDGERYQCFQEDVAERQVILVGGTISDADTLELYDLAFGAARGGARDLTVIIPYFGYSTMERASKDGEIVTAKARARLFSSVPRAADGTRVVMVDLHSEGIPHYFEGDVAPVHLYARPVILEAIREVGGGSFVLGSTDAGRAKWVESLANHLGVAAGFVLKRRVDGSRTEVLALSADVKGQTVVLYDDMIRTGSSLLQAASAYKAAGAARVSVVATHGVFPRDAAATLKKSGLLEVVVVTDTHPAALEAAAAVPGFIRVKSVASLLGQWLAHAVR